MNTGKRKRVLIVDNNDKDCAAIAECASSIGYEALSTWSGREALKLLAIEQFDLLLVDPFVADMYVGEFVNLVSRLTTRPLIALTGPGQGKAVGRDRTLRRCAVFDKTKPVELVQALGTVYLEQTRAHLNCAYIA